MGNVVEFNLNFPYGAGKTERVIEIPWALSKYDGGPRVLEVGCSFASENPEYIQGLMALNIPELHGIDVSSVNAPHFIKKTADIRESGYEPGFFDFVLCISTLEHVGKDSTKYYKPVAEIRPDRQSPSQPERRSSGGNVSDSKTGRQTDRDRSFRQVCGLRLVYPLRLASYLHFVPVNPNGEDKRRILQIHERRLDALYRG
jgi:hypothetical protein